MLSEPLEKMSATAETTKLPCLAIDPEYNWISFPFTNDKGTSFVEGTVTLENFLWACSAHVNNLERGINIHRVLVGINNTHSTYFGGEFDMRTPGSQEKYFKTFLQVI